MVSRRRFIQAGVAAGLATHLPFRHFISDAYGLAQIPGLSDPAFQPKFAYPVPDALVDVTFTGDFNTTIYDVVTNSSGVAVAETWGCVFKPSFTATVIDVTHDTLPHNSNDDVEDNCSD